MRRVFVSGVLVAWLFACACALAACAQRRDLGGDEPALVAWWLEDVAHARTRSGGELDVPSASQGLQRIARWARGADATHPELPNPIARRRERWPTLRALIADGVVATDAATGGVVLASGVGSHAGGAFAEQLVRAENGDRDVTDLTTLTLGRADDAAARAYRRAIRDARRRLDRDTR